MATSGLALDLPKMELKMGKDRCGEVRDARGPQYYLPSSKLQQWGTIRCGINYCEARRKSPAALLRHAVDEIRTCSSGSIRPWAMVERSTVYILCTKIFGGAQLR